MLFLVAPIIGETDAEAQEKKRLRAARAAEQLPQRLAHLGKVTNIDFGKFDLDAPLPEGVTTNGHQQTLDEFRAKAAGRTLRDTMSQHNATELSVELVGTPDSVAAQMAEVMEGAGGDGLPVLRGQRQPPHVGRSGGRTGPGVAGSRPGARGTASATRSSATICWNSEPALQEGSHAT